jgi:hypothetical protein
VWGSRKVAWIACHPDPAGGYEYHGSRTLENIVLFPKRIGTLLEEVGLKMMFGADGLGHHVVKEIHQKTRPVMTVFHLLLDAVHLEYVQKYKMCHGGSRLASYKIYNFGVETCWVTMEWHHVSM